MRGIIAAPARAIVTAARRSGMPGGIAERGRRVPTPPSTTAGRKSKVESRKSLIVVESLGVGESLGVAESRSMRESLPESRRKSESRWEVARLRKSKSL